MSDLIKNITGRIFLIIVAALIVLSGYFLATSYYENINQAEKDTLSRLHSIAKTLSLQVSGSKLEMLLDMYTEMDDISHSSQNDYYLEQHKKLKKAQELNNIEPPIYTLTRNTDTNTFYFGVTSATEPYFRHKYHSAPKELIKNYKEGGTIHAYEDENGTWLSAFSPITNEKDEVAGVLMVDMHFDKFIHEARMKLLRDGSITLGIFLLVGFLLIRSIKTVLKQEEKYKSELQRTNRLIESKNVELQKLSLVASRTDNIIIMVTPDGEIEWVNDHYCRMIGYNLEELKKEKGPTIYDSSNNPHIKEHIDTAVREKRSIIYESVNKTRDGGEYWASTTLTPIFSDEGELRYIIIVDANIDQLKKAEQEIRQKNEQLEEKNQEITSSIDYASKIQESIIPLQTTVKEQFRDAFIIFEPKDIVSGDLYWYARIDENRVLIAAIDCTGHGVPGAMMSVIAHSSMNEVVMDKKITQPGDILTALNQKVIKALRQDGGNVQSADGMDVALCLVNMKTKKVDFAGAYRPLHYIQNGELKVLKGDRYPIGSAQHKLDREFTNQSIELAEGDLLYLSSDGFVDQFGGPKNKKFTQKRLDQILMDVKDQNLQDQYNELIRSFLEWKDDYEQIDDVTFIGIRL